jgi:fluoroacetyl-CoA thioesterase
MLDLEKILDFGPKTIISSVISKVVQPADTAANYNEVLSQFMATPAWVDMAIRAAMDAVDKRLPYGYMTVGTHIEVTHEAPTCVGMKVNVKATLAEITNGNRLIFEIEAWDDLGEIGKGTYERHVVSQAALLQKAGERWEQLAKRRPI